MLGLRPSTKLAGKFCVVTGASKGIGKGIALQLGKNSAKVYITGRSKDKLESCAHEIEQWGGKVHTVHTVTLNDCFTSLLVILQTNS